MHAASLDRMGSLSLLNAIKNSDENSYQMATVYHEVSLTLRPLWPYASTNIAIAESRRPELTPKFHKFVKKALDDGRYDRIAAYDLMVLLTNNYSRLDVELQAVALDTIYTSIAMKANRPATIAQQLKKTGLIELVCDSKTLTDREQLVCANS